VALLLLPSNVAVHDHRMRSQRLRKAVTRRSHASKKSSSWSSRPAETDTRPVWQRGVLKVEESWMEDLVHRSRRRFLIVLIAATLTALPWTAEASPFCPGDQKLPFMPAIARLHEQVGSAMGDPIECVRTDRTTGGAHQQTTTGIAVYQQDGSAATFTNGRDFWRMTPEGLLHWEGWHGRAGPSDETAAPVVKAEESAPVSATPVDRYSTVEAATVLQVIDGDRPRLVLQHESTAYAVDVSRACSDDQPLPGRVVFVISKDSFAEPNSRLILRIGGRECFILASHTLAS
jgi:hypothetical protein